MNPISTFQAVVLGIFFFFIIVGVIIFAGITGGGQPTLGAITVWGTFNGERFNQLLSSMDIATKASAASITYVEKNPATFAGDLVNAIASGRAPSLVLLPQELLLAERDKLLLISEKTLPSRTIKDTFVQEGELFLFPGGGTYGIPFSVDPLVMYWNRDLLFGSGTSNPPKTWDDMVALAPKLSVRSGNGTITRSAVALGGWSNSENAKATLSALFFQVGTPIVGLSSQGTPAALLDVSSGDVLATADSALRFYTDFGNPSKTTYSWNRALPEARRLFVGSSLVFYFGFASELPTIKAQNPNLNFDVAELPQIKGASAPVTFGNLTALAIPNTAENQARSAGLLSVASLLITPEFQAAFADAFATPPARRDALGTAPTDPASAVFYRSALIARGWLDPNPKATSGIFKSMVESVTSGQYTVRQAIVAGQNELSAFFIAE